MLLARRPDGTWGIPGGWARWGETPWQTARREFVEEMGGMPRIDLVSAHRVGNYTTFVATITDDETEWWVPMLNEEHDRWGWFSVREAARLPLHPGVAIYVR